MAKPNFLLCDIAELTKPNNSLFKTATKHNAKDFALVGDSYELVSKTNASYCVLITEGITEDEAKTLLTEAWTQAQGEAKIFAWIPLNDIKEMVVLNLETNTQMRVQMLASMLKLTGADKYIQNNAPIKDLNQLKAMLAA